MIHALKKILYTLFFTFLFMINNLLCAAAATKWGQRGPLSDIEQQNLVVYLQRIRRDIEVLHYYDTPPLTIKRTPLIAACMDNKFSMAEILLKAKADPNAKNGYGMTPLRIAITSNNIEVAQLLLDYGADGSDFPGRIVSDSGRVIEKLSSEEKSQLGEFLGELFNGPENKSDEIIDLLRNSI